MARTSGRRSGGSAGAAGARPARPAPPRTQPAVVEVVDPLWILKALLLCLAGAAVCAYLAVCLLVYQGSWQLMLKPSARVDRTPAALGLHVDLLRFDAAETGTPRLAGWWIPGARQDAPTLLVIHDGKGSLSSTVELLALLHASGANVFAFDYRGFGQSEPTRPGEQTMAEDTAAALDYLVNTRHLAPAGIVPVGLGLGAALAASLVHAHPELPALILDNPDPGARTRVLHAEQSRLLPVGLLIREHFDLEPVLGDLRRPKLLITGGPNDGGPDRDAAALALYRSLPDPKRTLVLDAPGRPQHPAATIDAEYVNTLVRFLDEYLPGRMPGAAPLPTHAAPLPTHAAPLPTHQD